MHGKGILTNIEGKEYVGKWEDGELKESLNKKIAINNIIGGNNPNLKVKKVP